MVILKAVSIKLDEDKVLLATLQYHVEKGNRAASRYRWLARVCKVEDIKAKISELKSDALRLEGWKWPNDPSWNGKICTNDSTNARAAAWLQLKLSKAVSWDEGQKLLNGFKKTKNAYNPKAVYEIEGYTCTDGSTVSLADKEALISKVGQNLAKEQTLKTLMA